MENLQFNAVQACDGTITISDNLSQISPDFEDTVTVDIVTLEKSDGPKLAAEVFTTHDKKALLNEAKLPLGEDGLYTITHLTIPTLDWYKKQSDLRNFKDIYVTENSRIFKLQNKEFVEVDPLDFTTNINLEKSTVSKFSKLYFFNCYLWKCYVYLCNKILNHTGKEDELKNLEYDRDFVWITIYVIKYLVEDCKLTEAQKILEAVEACNGFCYKAIKDSQETFESYDYSCGLTSGKVYQTSCGCN